ncbi:hypothetical protein ACWDX6_28740 [Streptomyces sp. NPDC003027]
MVQERCVRLASAADAEAVSALRREAYARNHRFEVIDGQRLEWGESDEQCAVLGVWGPEGLLATSRWACAGDAGRAGTVLACDMPHRMAFFPAIVGGRGATREDMQGHGLTSLLEWHAFRAVAELDVAGVLAWVDSPRLGHFERLGFRTTPTRLDEAAGVAVPAPHLAFLPAAMASQALRGLDSRTAPLRASFPWCGPPLGQTMAGMVAFTRSARPSSEQGTGGTCAR